MTNKTMTPNRIPESLDKIFKQFKPQIKINNPSVLRNIELDPDKYLIECYNIIMALSFQVEEAHFKIAQMMGERNGSCTAGEEQR